jgi:hypothetical protein
MTAPQNEAAGDVVGDPPSEQYQPIVRFSLPDKSASSVQADESPAASRPSESSPPAVTAAEIRALSKALHGAPLQQRRMNVFQFEPISLPASRVCIPQHSVARRSLDNAPFLSFPRQLGLRAAHKPGCQAPPTEATHSDLGDVSFGKRKRIEEKGAVESADHGVYNRKPRVTDINGILGSVARRFTRFHPPPHPKFSRSPFSCAESADFDAAIPSSYTLWDGFDDFRCPRSSSATTCKSVSSA